jgi:hypothetical protein
MPSPQTLVAFSVSLFVLLVVLRAHLGLGPNVSAALSFVVAFSLAAVVERLVPPEPDEEEGVELANQEHESAPPERGGESDVSS